jgi:hypothetical protein
MNAKSHLSLNYELPVNQFWRALTSERRFGLAMNWMKA